MVLNNRSFFTINLVPKRMNSNGHMSASSIQSVFDINPKLFNNNNIPSEIREREKKIVEEEIFRDISIF